MEFFRITGRDQNGARLITEVEAQCIEDGLCTVDSETTEAVEQIDPDSAEIFGEIYKKVKEPPSGSMRLLKKSD